MPILWRYALQSYLRVFSLSVSTFIFVLIISRFKEIARFTALSGDWLKSGLYILYQVPTILPMAIPISALIASLLLFQKLSRTYELTALRASGMSLKNVLTPLLVISLILSILNFSFCADISPYCRREAKTLFYQETSENPLLLLRRHKLAKIKHSYLNMVTEDEKKTKDLTLITYNERNQRLSLISAPELRIEGEKLLGKGLTIVSFLNSEKENDSLIIENQTGMSTAAPLLSIALKKNRPRLDLNALGIRMLRSIIKEGGKKEKSAYIEILRRFSLSIAVFSFTLLGSVFGIEQGRVPKKKNLFTALTLTLLVLMSYLFGKGLKNSPHLAFCAFLLPHPLIWLSSFFQLKRISGGRG